MSLKDLEKKDLLQYISKKKDDELKMMNIVGITIGAIIILFLNIFINSLNDIPIILSIKGFTLKIIFLFTHINNIICGIFICLTVKFSGNNEELLRNHNQLKERL
ncbi:MAG TPA: hypothetical protein VHT96_08235, partial [Clostridia bacterium]|nr:hypothetical protein [Clostridia bacterium]